MSDFRYSGGTSASIAEEISAQAAMGLSTVLLQVRSPALRKDRPINQRIAACLDRGEAVMAGSDERIRATVLVIRQPRIFIAEPRALPRVEAAETVMVVNQSPGDWAGDAKYYQPDEVRTRVEKYFGGGVRWMPIGPLVRTAVRNISPSFPFTADYWYNIIDVQSWWSDRPAPVADRPVVGRHGRAEPAKWPQTEADILAVYPESEDLLVRILGGGEIPVRTLGRTPRNWELLPFGTVPPREFLHSIDYFVYYHDPGLVEAFGRTVLEAMASGAPAILPSSFAPLFGDAALYAAPDDVPELVRTLHRDWQRTRAVAAAARGVVEDRFGRSAHARRLTELGVSLPPTAGGS